MDSARHPCQELRVATDHRAVTRCREDAPLESDSWGTDSAAAAWYHIRELARPADDHFPAENQTHYHSVRVPGHHDGADVRILPHVRGTMVAAGVHRHQALLVDFRMAVLDAVVVQNLLTAEQLVGRRPPGKHAPASLSLGSC